MANNDILSIQQNYQIVGRSPLLQQAINAAVQAAPYDVNVLVCGENGVGKEVFHKILHNLSPRRYKKCIAVNCGGLPEGTIDSELFGHVKGAFTGALSDRKGYFEEADGGTIFLDEIGELPLATQARLLRVIETGEYFRMGSGEVRKTDVRIVAATNVQIEKAIREGKFREDLYYRLCTISVKMPPLRERGEDVLLLFKKFAMDTAQQYSIPEPLRLTPEAGRVMMLYKWPGNIRQFKNVVEQMSILSEQRIITPEILQQYDITPSAETTDLVLRDASVATQPSDGTVEHTLKMMQLMIHSLKMDVEMLKEKVDNGSRDSHLVHQLPAPIQYSELSERTDYAETPELPDDEDEEDLNLEKMERRMIEKALRRSRNRRKVAADELGISERTLYRKIKDYGIEE